MFCGLILILSYHLNWIHLLIQIYFFILSDTLSAAHHTAYFFIQSLCLNHLTVMCYVGCKRFLFSLPEVVLILNDVKFNEQQSFYLKQCSKGLECLSYNFNNDLFLTKSQVQKMEFIQTKALIKGHKKKE